MPETEQGTAAPQQSGIFEPKEFHPADLPLSGPQKATRMIVVILVLALAAGVFLLLRNPFMKPVKRFYSGLNAGDAAKMCEAFPSWIVNSGDESAASVYAMCNALLSTTQMYYGKEAECKPELQQKTAIEEAYLEQLASGIETTFGISVKITKGWKLRLGVTVRSGDESQTLVQYVRVYWINGRWVMIDVPSNTE